MVVDIMIVGVIDKLVDRVIQLINYRKQIRKTVLDEYVGPTYSEFEKVHKAYLDSFEKYRELLQASIQLDMNSPILDIIQKDNLFTADQRAKVFELAKVAEDDLVGSFVQSIYRYLVDARVVDPLAPERIPDLVYVQFWRRSLIEVLSNIFDENWQGVIDPFGGRPLLDDEQIELELEQMFKKFNIELSDTRKIEKLKRALALKELDNIVYEMQSAYQEVTGEFNKLKKDLSK